MVTPVFMRAKVPKAVPVMNRVKDFAIRYWQALFLGLVGVVIVAVIVYKCRETKRQPKAPTDGEVIAKVCALDAKGLQRLLDAGGNASSKVDGIPAVVVAIAGATLFEKRGKETFDCLVKAGADCQALDSQKRSVLHHAVIQSRGSDYFLKELFKKKVKLNCIDSCRKKPLDYAKDLEVFDLLVDQGAKPSAAHEQWRKEMKKSEIIFKQIREQQAVE